MGAAVQYQPVQQQSQYLRMRKVGPVQDAEYEKAGAKIVASGDSFGQDIVLKVRPPSGSEAGMLKEEST